MLALTLNYIKHKALTMKSNKVLVVEDNELNMKLFQDLLSIIKCDIASTRSGRNAIDLCKEFSPDLILMDIQLDGVSGIDLIRYFKNDINLKSIPIVAISAFAMKNEEEAILESGCDKYLSKPISIEDFFVTVKFFLNRSHQEKLVEA
jgi:two-component system, cell cycle response regulator DivK